MSKFHINKHGIPAPCKAKSGRCPLGSKNEHFDTKEQAQDFANKIYMAEHGVMPELVTMDLISKKGDKSRITEFISINKSIDEISAIAKNFNPNYNVSSSIPNYNRKNNVYQSVDMQLKIGYTEFASIDIDLLKDEVIVQFNSKQFDKDLIDKASDKITKNMKYGKLIIIKE